MSGKGLTKERILSAAVTLVDAAGLDALSMRKLGEALGVEAMSLYRHVANKQTLLDGVHATLLGEMQVRPSGSSWEARVTDLARAFREVLLAHPRALPLFATRPAVAPASLRQVDAALGTLQEAGLPETEQLGVLHAMVAYVVGTCLAQAAWTDELLPDIAYAELPADEYPNLRRLAGQIAEEDPDEEFELGLQVLLAGLRTRLPGA